MKRLQVLMYDLEEIIQAITDEMDEVIAFCPVLSKQRELLMSIDGEERAGGNPHANYYGGFYVFW